MRPAITAPSRLAPIVTLALLAGCGDGTIVSAGTGNRDGGGGSGGSAGGGTGGSAGAGGASGGSGAGGAAGSGGGAAGSGAGGAGGAGTGGTGGAAGSGGAPPAGGKVGEVSRIPIATGGKVTAPFRLAASFEMAAPSSEKSMESTPVLADMNGDGKLDLWMNPRLGYLATYAGKGDGTFGPASPVKVGGTGASAAITTGRGADAGDFTGDGKMDAVMSHEGGSYGFKNTGGGALVESGVGLLNASAKGLMLPRGIGGSMYGSILGDVSGDGKMDFVSGNFIAFGDGAGGWGYKPTNLPPLDITTESPDSPKGHFLADFDGDGALDLVTTFVVYGGINTVRAAVCMNGGDGTSWTCRGVLSGLAVGTSFGPKGPMVLSATDASGDGKLDLAVAGRLLLGDGKGGFASQSTGIPLVGNNHFGDMDGDGDMDLVTFDHITGLALWLGDGTGKGWTKADVGLPGVADIGAYGLDVGNLDGNGHLDIVITRYVAPPDENASIETWVR